MADGSCDVLILGAGPAGLVAAAVLAEQGVDFRIVDRASGPVAQSRAVIVHVRTLELLDRLGLAARALRLRVRTTGVEIHARGRRAGGFQLAGPGSREQTAFPYALGLEQDRLERLLVERLTELGVQVEWNTELVALTDGPGGPRAVVIDANDASQTITARWVIGADGSRSAVRQALGVGSRDAPMTRPGCSPTSNWNQRARGPKPCG